MQRITVNLTRPQVEALLAILEGEVGEDMLDQMADYEPRLVKPAKTAGAALRRALEGKEAGK